MKNQDLKSGLFGSIGENMVAFELAKRNWYLYRPYFETRIDFVAQKFVCKKCFSDWESKHLVRCSNINCKNYKKDLNEKKFIKSRKCPDCGFLFYKYSEKLRCPDCNNEMSIRKQTTSGQRNYVFSCPKCKKSFTSQTRTCVKCGSNKCIEYPVCKICYSEIEPKRTKCQNQDCDSTEYAVIFRTIQVKSSHEEKRGTIAFNFKLQDLIEDKRHFLVVYSRTFDKEYNEKHNYWLMSVEEFKNEYVKKTASALIYQNARLHPPKEESGLYFNEVEFKEAKIELIKAREAKDSHKIKQLEEKLRKIDVFGKLNVFIEKDF